MRVSMILSALAATALASPTVYKRDNTLGGLVPSSTAQMTNVLSNIFGTITNINNAYGQLHIGGDRIANPLNIPSDLFGDVTLLTENSGKEILSLVSTLNDAMTGQNLSGDIATQMGVVPGSIQIVTGQVEQLIDDLTGISNFIPNSQGVTTAQTAANSLLSSLNKLQGKN
ncbi:hypothetical protein DV735_g1399, partial [Chaetothyriales sp. CBS 134920]